MNYLCNANKPIRENILYLLTIKVINIKFCVYYKVCLIRKIRKTRLIDKNPKLFQPAERSTIENVCYFVTSTARDSAGVASVAGIKGLSLSLLPMDSNLRPC